MAAREHVLGLAAEVMDTAAARHSHDDFLDVNHLVQTTSAKWNYGNPSIDLWISINRIMDIHKSNYGCQQIELWISTNRRIMDIHNRIMDIHN